MKLAALALALIVVAPNVRAADTAACLTSFNDAQVARKDGHLLDARNELRACSNAECPVVVRQKCFEWLGEVESAIPTIVVTAHSADGHDVPDATLAIDGKPAAERLDGKALEIDPGEHVLEVRHGGRSIKLTIVVVPSIKNRVVAIELEPPAQQPPPPVHSAPSLVPPLVASAFALAGFATFGYFGIKTRSDLADMRETCAPACDEDRVTSAKRTALVADIGLGVGIVGAGVATALFLIRGRSEPEKTAHVQIFPSYALGPSLTIGGQF